MFSTYLLFIVFNCFLHSYDGIWGLVSSYSDSDFEGIHTDNEQHWPNLLEVLQVYHLSQCSESLPAANRFTVQNNHRYLSGGFGAAFVLQMQ